MNNDLISRSAAIEAIEKREPFLVGDKRVGVDSFKNFLKNRPAVDAEPVRHGRWVKEPDRSNHWHCSECGLVVGRFHSTYGYCYNCGAKMEGDKT